MKKICALKVELSEFKIFLFPTNIPWMVHASKKLRAYVGSEILRSTTLVLINFSQNVVVFEKMGLLILEISDWSIFCLSSFFLFFANISRMVRLRDKIRIRSWAEISSCTTLILMYFSQNPTVFEKNDFKVWRFLIGWFFASQVFFCFSQISREWCVLKRNWGHIDDQKFHALQLWFS